MYPVPLPAPFKGVDEQIPTIAIQSPFCENLLNFNVTRAGIELRKGDSKYKTVGANTYTVRAMVPYSATKLLILAGRSGPNTDIIDVDGNTVGLSVAVLTAALTTGTLSFNNYLFFFNADATNPGWYYNGSAYGALGYTGTDFKPIGGNVYKNRAYIIQYNSSSYWYSGISAISGALTAVDLATVISEKSNLAIIAKVTLADTVESVVLQAFIFFSGEIIFYSGSYPDSPDWGEVGRAKIGTPLHEMSGLIYQGDYLVFCSNGVISLRDLFLKGSEEAANLTINNRIEKTWRSFVNKSRSALASGTGRITATMDTVNTRIIINFPGYVHTDDTWVSGCFFFIYNTVLKCWFFHKSNSEDGSPCRYITFYDNKVLYTQGGNVNIFISEKEGATNLTDRSSADSADRTYTYEVISAPITNSSYVQKCEGLDVIMNSDLYGQTNFYLIKDLGVKTSTAQKTTAPVSTIQKPFINMGIEGSHIQYKISGTTTTGKTTGLKIYGTNFWISKGESPR